MPGISKTMQIEHSEMQDGSHVEIIATEYWDDNGRLQVSFDVNITDRDHVEVYATTHGNLNAAFEAFKESSDKYD